MNYILLLCCLLVISAVTYSFNNGMRYIKSSSSNKILSSSWLKMSESSTTSTSTPSDNKQQKGKSQRKVQDLSSLKDDVIGKQFNASVKSTHAFGLFATVEELGVEGLVPISKLPGKITPDKIKDVYKTGAKVTIKVETINRAENKLVFSMRVPAQRGANDVTGFLAIDQKVWLQAQVVSATKFGLFVRPNGQESQGLIPGSQVPRDLISALKQVQPVDASKDKTDVEQLFQSGDIVKCRIQKVDSEAGKVSFSMLPYKASNDDEDDYVVEGRDPEGEEEQDNLNDDDEDDDFDAQSTLLWWKGGPYVKVVPEDEKIDEEEAVLLESKKVVEGAWRRMFEVDMRQDENDFNSKALEAEIKELEEEIGELDGLDYDMIDAVGFSGGLSTNKKKVGSFVGAMVLPAEWKEELEFFKELETLETSVTTGLRAGKEKEKSEFETLIREVEQELEKVTPKRPVEPVVAAVAAAADEPVAAE